MLWDICLLCMWVGKGEGGGGWKWSCILIKMKFPQIFFCLFSFLSQDEVQSHSWQRFCTFTKYVTFYYDFNEEWFSLSWSFIDMEYLEVLTEGLERVLMVRGGGREVITIYSWILFHLRAYNWKTLEAAAVTTAKQWSSCKKLAENCTFSCVFQNNWSLLCFCIILQELIKCWAVFAIFMYFFFITQLRG